MRNSEKAVAVPLVAETSEMSKIAKPAILPVLDIVLAVVDSVAATTAVKRLAQATVAIS